MLEMPIDTPAPEADDANPQEAQHILQRLGESGQPPEFGVLRLNVGNESYLDVLERAYLTGQLAHGASFKLVQGYFGGGKTHFLYCVRELAWRHDYAVAIVELSPAECPYDDSLRVYRAAARRLAGPRDGMEPKGFGLTELLRDLVDERLAAERAKGARDDGRDDPVRRVRSWLSREVVRTPCESVSYRQACVAFCLAWLDQDDVAERRLEAWLLGEPVPAGEVRDDGVYESMSKANGFLMLRAMTQMIAGLGFAGTVLLFDEVDRNLSVSAKRSQQIGDNLRQVIDLCGRHQLPRTLFMYAVPPEFMRNVVPDYPALYQRLKSPMTLSVSSPQAVLIDLEKLDLQPEALLREMAARIIAIFNDAQGAYGMGSPLDAAMQRANAEKIARVTVGSQFEVNHRRLFVKTFVDFLYRQAAEGEALISDEQAVDAVLGSHESLSAGDAIDDDFADF